MIDTSGSPADDSFARFQKELLAKCLDASVSSTALVEYADNAVARLKSVFGHVAEYWLLLSVAEVVACSTTRRSTPKAGEYRNKAVKCENITAVTLRKTGQILTDILKKRADRNDCRASAFAVFAAETYYNRARILELVTAR